MAQEVVAGGGELDALKEEAGKWSAQPPAPREAEGGGSPLTTRLQWWSFVPGASEVFFGVVQGAASLEGSPGPAFCLSTSAAGTFGGVGSDTPAPTLESWVGSHRGPYCTIAGGDVF